MTARVAPPSDPEDLMGAALEGDRAALARLVSMIERGGADAREVARITFPRSGKAYTIGMTGAPGSGKSTLTDHLIGKARSDGSQVAVLAVDPSSPFSGGAILGDRVRMQDHALDGGVYIRSMATRGHMGGLALAVPETVRALDAVGMGTILLETVGVGQIEVAVADATDTTVVVVNPGWGDAVQANKAGLLEIADIFVINKADRPGVPEARRELDQMLDLSRLGSWRPPIVATTATTAEGVTELWEQLGRHREHLVAEGALDRRRAERLVEELRQVVVNRMTERGDRLCSSEEFEEVRRAVISHRMDPYDAAEKVMERLAD